jgi:hypothetical protein
VRPKQFAVPGWVFLVVLALIVTACDLPNRQSNEPSYGQPAPESFQPTEARLDAEGVTSSVRGARISKTFFESTGATPVLGRLPIGGEFEPGTNAVIVISYALWQERFNGDTSVVGRQVMLDGVATVVVGVMPRGFKLPDQAQFWMPMSAK